VNHSLQQHHTKKPDLLIIIAFSFVGTLEYEVAQELRK
jgi:hypothetical protein